MKNLQPSSFERLAAMPRTKLAIGIRLALMFMLVALLAGCPWNTRPNVPKQVIVTVTEYRDLPAWIQPVPVYQRSGTTVGDHLTAECRHKADQMVANCRIAAAQAIGAGKDVKPEACAVQVECRDQP